MNFDKIYDSILESALGLSMGTMWQHISNYMKNMNESYEIRKDIFFMILEKLMKDGHIKLAYKNEYLNGTIKEQLQQFKAVWPPYPSDDELDDLDDFGLWFFAKAPGGIVWITDNGQEIWT